MEVMGLHLPGASFIQPNTPLRDALTAAAARQITRLTETGINCIDGNHIDVNHINSSHINSSYLPVGQLVDEKWSSMGLSRCWQPAVRLITPYIGRDGAGGGHHH